ncbi:uncharacterized protein HMPREF1541_06966 [Cyphellophora europaea CBS 101466]|uniref:Proteasome component ECM29 n=1 Tax=Cyphellophora europaea (strain CBS 101466) TaxID=1220924 RepID=W2RT96_CYPE1|nr:uncharacterized protein HMPREF1541_06966 [Cyphellophora europaea CBS 101466]ETN38924.1 hypothetical protein HMPREF1541_06966 [Cyphellophora europaea CBS 101466]
MAAAPPADPVREYQLIEKLELRIAGAKNDEQFEDIIQKFLPALILKLASETERNRNLTIKVCQYVNQRLKISQSIQVPLPGLFKNLQSTESAFVRRFSLVFIQQGLGRVRPADAPTILQEVLKFAVPETPTVDATTQKLWSIAFDFLLDGLRQWKAPERRSKEDVALKEKLDLSSPQCDILASHISRFLLYDPKLSSTVQGLHDDFKVVFEKQYRQRTSVVPPLADFLFTAVFGDSQRLIPATIMTVDANAAASSKADVMFKQCNFDLESESSVETLFDLYDRSKPKLQTRILSLLSRSQKSTESTGRILALVNKQLSSPDTGLEASKLRAAIFSYLSWAVRISSSMGEVAEKIQVLLKDYVELQGWPTPQDRSPAESELRAKAYESIGLLASVKSPNSQKPQQPNMNLITWLFTSLRCDETRDIRGSIEEALSRIMNIVPTEDGKFAPALIELLLWNVRAEPGDEDPTYYFPTVHSTRYTAVRFANKCLSFSDTTARLIDVLAVGLADRKELADEGERGLDPYWHISNQNLARNLAPTDKLDYPSFTSLADRFFNSADSQHLLSNKSSLSTAIIFCRNILVSEALQQTSNQLDDSAEWKSQIDGLILNSASARTSIRDRLDRLPEPALAQFLQLAVQSTGSKSEQHAEVALQLLSLCKNSVLSLLRSGGMVHLREELLQTDTQRRAARALGIFESLNDTASGQVISYLDQCSEWESAIGSGAVKVRGSLLAATFIATRSSLRQSADMQVVVTRITSLLTSMILQSSDLSIKNTAIACLGQIALCTKPEKELPLAPPDVVEALMKECKKQNGQAILAMGRLVGFKAGSEGDEATHGLLDRLFTLYEVKQAEFHFALGEALSVAVTGFQSSATMNEFDVRAELPPWGFHPKLQEYLMEALIEKCQTTKPTLRKAAAIWLLSMVQYCGDVSAVQSRLRQCQAAFARLLTDRDEIVQEAGSRGLGIVYEKGDKGLRDDLVRDLVHSFTGSGAKMSGTVNEDTQLFEAGTLPTERGESVTTYKDIVSLATEMGDPSLVYKFMNLASNNAIWSSRAAFGKFGLSSVLADSTYLAENKKFYPKLFRYRFDPNPNVQRSMNEIWRALVKDPAAVVDQNFGLIMDDLLKSVLSGKEWRAREASCAAISDLVSGRDIEKLEGYLDEIWKVAFKVLDDVKESVRVAAMKLCRTLTNMLVRNLEVGQGDTKRATTLLNHAMPFLLQQMAGAAGAQEVQQYATVTLLEVVKKSPPKSLQPFAPVILETLVNSLSSLEHESINYLHLNADKYGMTAEKLDKMRVSSVNASPVTEAIDRCLESLTATKSVEANSDDAMEGVESTAKAPMDDAMQRLESCFKTAIGLPSRVGLSRVMVTLVVRHPSAFRPFADRFARLHRKHIIDRNATISVAFSTSLGYLMRLASEKEIHATSKYAQKLFFESQDLTHRAVAGEILQSISKTSNDVFLNFGSTFLPFAFIGRNDTDEQVRERFDPPWKDNIGGSRAAQLYLKEISDLIMLHIKSPLWPIRHACCFSVAALVTSLASHGQNGEAEAALVWPLVQEALNGKTWEGKERVVSAFPKFVESVPSLWTDPSASDQMVKIALREAKRQNETYRPHAIQALGEFAKSRRDLNLSEQVVPWLVDLVEELANDDAMEIDGEKDSDRRTRSKTMDRTLEAVGLCLFEVLSPRGKADVLGQAGAVVNRLHAQKSPALDTALCQQATSFFMRVVKEIEENEENQRRGCEGTNQNGAYEIGAGSGLEAFSEQLILALLSHFDHASAPESARQARVELGSVLAGSPTLTTAQSRGRLAPILDSWLQTERSRPLRDDMAKAVEMLKRAETGV